MKRFLYNFLYVLFAIGGPIGAVLYQFPLVEWSEASAGYKIGLGLFLSLLIVIVFFTKNFVEFAKSFDRVTWLKGLSRWLVFVFPSLFGFGFAIATYKFGEMVVPIMAWTFISHTVAGIFLVLALNEKAKDFKKWVNK